MFEYIIIAIQTNSCAVAVTLNCRFDENILQVLKLVMSLHQL